MTENVQPYHKSESKSYTSKYNPYNAIPSLAKAIRENHSLKREIMREKIKKYQAINNFLEKNYKNNTTQIWYTRANEKRNVYSWKPR